MDLARGLDTLLVAGVVAALAPLLVALLPGPGIPQVVILLDWPDILREPPQVVLPAFLGVGGEDAGGRRGELGQGSHPLARRPSW